VELYLYSKNTPSWRGAELKHIDKFTFTVQLRIYLGLFIDYVVYLPRKTKVGLIYVKCLRTAVTTVSFCTSIFGISVSVFKWTE
jgi:hypothetical protein